MNHSSSCHRMPSKLVGGVAVKPPKLDQFSNVQWSNHWRQGDGRQHVHIKNAVRSQAAINDFPGSPQWVVLKVSMNWSWGQEMSIQLDSKFLVDLQRWWFSTMKFFISCLLVNVDDGKVDSPTWELCSCGSYFCFGACDSGKEIPQEKTKCQHVICRGDTRPCFSLCLWILYCLLFSQSSKLRKEDRR